MPAKTIQVDQFLLNVLQPEIDALNLSLLTMEENGFSSKAIIDTRRKLNKLLPMYDFLKEYAYGNEEVEDKVIDQLMQMTGVTKTSFKSLNPIIQATRESLDINKNRETYSSVRVYKDDEILLTDVIPTASSNSTFKIFSTNNSDRIEVTFGSIDLTPETYTGIDSVTISNVDLESSEFLEFEVVTYRGDIVLTEETLSYAIMYPACEELTYWVGADVETFTIDTGNINETTDITIDPNSGTIVGGTQLTYDWVVTNLDPSEEYYFRETTTQNVTVEVGDSHCLIMFPTFLEVTDIKEVVFDLDTGDEIPEDAIDMTEGIHYDRMTFNSTIREYTCIYFRDLTSNFFPERTFQFTIDSV